MGPLVDHLVALGRVTALVSILALAGPAQAAPRYALSSYSASAGAGGEPYPLAAVALTVGLAWIPIAGPTLGYTYAGDPIRGGWVGVGQLTAGGAGFFAGYVVGALASPWLVAGRQGEAQADTAQRGADLGAGYGTLAGLVAYTVWMAFDVYRVAEANAAAPRY